MTVDEQEYIQEKWQEQDAKLLKQQTTYQLAIHNISGPTGHLIIDESNGYGKCNKCGSRAKVNNADYW